MMDSDKPEVILVDADPILLSMHKRSLEMLLHCQVRIFETGLAAMRHLTACGGAKLIIANHQMPDMTGLTLVRTLLFHPRLAGISVMVLTSGGGNKLSSLVSAGADSVMDKRTSPLQLAREAQRLMLTGRAPVVAAKAI